MNDDQKRDLTKNNDFRSRSEVQKLNSPRTPAQRFPVVGIGASAGGLAALRRLFEATAPNAGMAYVVVTHLDPDHVSHLPELLAKATEMDVVPATDGMAVVPDRVHIIPPDRTLTIRDGALRLSQALPRALRYPIDEFFRSLARDQQEWAIAVVLTGSGSDGSRGIREVKAEGGLVVVQDPDRADHDSMPRSAVATGLVDCVTTVEDVPRAIADYVAHAHLRAGDGDPGAAEAELQGILALLKAKGDFDFSWYKRSTVQRRIRRRMGLTRKSTMSAYLSFLSANASEIALLVSDMLIGVTAFFREPEAWDYLAENVLARLVGDGEESDPIRVWVPACSTGEEAYTIAILLTEELERQNSDRRIQIFATDVDDTALEAARAGLFSERAVTAIAPERLARFFVIEGESYRIKKSVRECIVFARQNLVTDSPFSRLDLISCRNLLIYFDSAQQDRVLSVFHFVLKNRGYLFLGNSETVGKHTAMYATVSKKWRIYRRIGTSRRPPLNPPMARNAAGLEWQRTARQLPVMRQSASEIGRGLLLEHCAPTAVLVDGNHEVLYFHGDTDRYLSPPQGEPTFNLLELARRGLRGRLRAALHRARLKRERVVLDEVRILRNGGNVPVTISVIPWIGDNDPERVELCLVTFADLPPRNDQSNTTIANDDSVAIAQLEDELRRTKEELQSTIEELETANEELKVSNEEATSMNEELQSTNEELETSKEELQSLNEELITINNQLEEKVTELQATTDDIDNLLVSSNIATLFLDREFRVKRFTPAITKLMRLIRSDIGRRIDDITSRLDTRALLEDAANVLDDLRSTEAEVRTDDAWYLRRILPYRSQNHRIEGVVVTFTDISEAKRRAAEYAHLAAVVSSSDDAILTKDCDGTILTWNHAAELMYGYRAEEIVGKNINVIIPADRCDEFLELARNIRQGGHVRRLETVRVTKDGQHIDVALSISPILGEDGTPAFFSAIERNVTDIKEAQRNVQRLNRDLERRVAELQALIDVAPVGISIALDPSCETITTNALAARMLSANAGDNVSLSAHGGPKTAYDVFSEGVPQAPELLPMQRAARNGTEVRGQELHLSFADGREIDILMSAAPLLDEDGKPRGAVGVFVDITERKHDELRLREQAEQLRAADRRKDDFLAVLGHELRNPLAPIRNILDLFMHQSDPDRATLRRGLDMMNRQVTQLTRLVDDLLDVARITHDDIQLKCEPVDLAALCARLAQDMRPALERSSQFLRFEPAQHESHLWADPVRIEQIITNLLNNASNYTPEGGNIWLCVSEEPGYAVINVRDDGVGIPLHDQQAIFDPFSRTASSLAHSGKTGLGLGLSLAQRLVQMHGGTIEVYSEGPGHGSEFTVRLPLSHDIEKKETLPAAPAANGSGRRVLLVEDNNDVSDALKALLEALGHQVRTVSRGEAAIGCAAEFAPEIAFIDIGLPDIDGYEVARRLRAQQSREPIVMVALSGYGRAPATEDQTTGFDEYLLKPLAFERIAEILLCL